MKRGSGTLTAKRSITLMVRLMFCVLSGAGRSAERWACSITVSLIRRSGRSRGALLAAALRSRRFHVRVSAGRAGRRNRNNPARGRHRSGFAGGAGRRGCAGRRSRQPGPFWMGSSVLEAVGARCCLLRCFRPVRRPLGSLMCKFCRRLQYQNMFHHLE